MTSLWDRPTDISPLASNMHYRFRDMLSDVIDDLARKAADERQRASGVADGTIYILPEDMQAATERVKAAIVKDGIEVW